MSEELAESTPPERTEFSPSILRRIVTWCVASLVGALVGILVMSLIQVLLVAIMSTEIEVNAVLLSTSAFFTSGAFLVLMVFVWVLIIGVLLLIWLISPRHGRLVFYDGKVRGQAKGAPWREVELPLSRLDRPRSCSRGAYQRLCGYQVLHSVNGEKIYWERASFSKEAVAWVLDRLRCD